ncbi:phospho-acceptor domain-containing protein [Paraburkholderia rhizosphaerae]|uniref:histidine kinase n=2 Tax=Paraburkholderia rhizosphaerae TaxID=480658 RepID=A0A4R8LCE5_9BURK|nr:phospho-acceptor domain-containing protein [Paraburkholderia rhizosphaerae]
MNEAAVRYVTGLSAVVDCSSSIRGQTDAGQIFDIFMRGVLSLCDASRALVVSRTPGKPVILCQAAQMGDVVTTHTCDTTLDEKPLDDNHVAATLARLAQEFAQEPFNEAADRSSGAQCAVADHVEWVSLNAGEIGGDLLLIGEAGVKVTLTTTARAFILLLAAQADLALHNVRLEMRVVQEENARQAAERDLIASELALAEGQRISRTGSWRWNPRTRRMIGSKEFFRIYDLPGQYDLSYHAFVARVYADDRPLFEQALVDAAAQCSVFKFEYRILIDDGSIRYLSAEAHPNLDPEGGLEFAGIVMDATERRLAAEALQAAQDELVRSLRFAAMGELAVSIIHEINQPLTAVVTNAETCLRWLARSRPEIEQARRAATRTTRDADRVAKVVTGLRALAWKTGFAKTAVDIDDAIREVALMLRSDIERNMISLRLALAAHLPVLGDRVQLQQVLLNLMRNAIEAMAGREGPRRLQVSTAMIGDEAVQITVHDNGLGFSADMKGRVFEAMYSTKKHGMGMGLPISRSIVEAHGGNLAVYSSPEQGTSFQFAVPCASE